MKEPRWTSAARTLIHAISERCGAIDNALVMGQHEVWCDFPNRVLGVAYRCIKDSFPVEMSKTVSAGNRIRRVVVWRFRRTVGILIHVEKNDF